MSDKYRHCTQHQWNRQSNVCRDPRSKLGNLYENLIPSYSHPTPKNHPILHPTGTIHHKKQIYIARQRRCKYINCRPAPSPHSAFSHHLRGPAAPMLSSSSIYPSTARPPFQTQRSELLAEPFHRIMSGQSRYEMWMYVCMITLYASPQKKICVFLSLPIFRFGV